MHFTEDDFENAILELFREQLGYDYVYSPNVIRDYAEPLYVEVLEAMLPQINRGLPQAAIDEAMVKIRTYEGGTLVQKNELFTDYLQNGVAVNYFDGREQCSANVRLVDYDSPLHNRFTIANQWTVDGHSVRRADMIVFVNGLPLVVVELKSPSRENTDVSEAYAQLRNYMQEIPSLFIYNAFCVMSDQGMTKAGTITAGEDRFMQWKTVDGSYEDTHSANFDVLFAGMFEKTRFVELLRNFICYSKDGKQRVKILSAYHQFYAVRKAVLSTVKAAETDGRGGVFWHTQGSGKSLSMVFFAKQLQQAMSSPTIVVLTDRNDLNGQLYRQFACCRDFLRQTPVQAESRAHLRELLAGREANGIFFSTMQKFEESEEPLSIRRNIVVMADEAHRSQYGLEERVRMVTDADGVMQAKVVIGAARLVRNALPNATYIGFTGTPIAQKDRSTREVFGDYIDVYDMTQSVDDGATRPVFYESRVINLKLDEQTGKAMIVAYSRPIAIKIYRRILEMRPVWGDKLAVVMTSGNKDPEDWRAIIGNDSHKKELEKRFKDNDSSLKIVIVVDMWLTGFDVPSLSTMYVYKPMSGHNLMQAIARVNRVFGDKQGGLVVDYVGIASALKTAMNDYTYRDRKNYGDTDVAKTAYPEFQKKLDVCRDLMYGFNYGAFFGKSDLERAKAISGGVDFMQSPERMETKKLYIKEALLLRQALSLCQSLLNYEQRIEAAYFEAVRTLLTRVEGKGKISFREINGRINELLKQSIKSEGVINLFSDIKEEFSLFDPKFLEEVARMKERNFAVELLRRLIAEQVQLYQRTNTVRAEKFSEILSDAMSRYLKGMLTNEEVIEELLKIAREIVFGEKAGESLNLNSEELAFYDALTKPEAVKDFYSNDQLIAITRELTDALRRNKTIDWNMKESARAGMRRIVKRLLKKYDYPPAGQEDALNTIMEQCKKWNENN